VNAGQRQKAEFFAQLASIPLSDDLSEEKEISFLSSLQTIFLPWLEDPFAVEEFEKELQQYSRSKEQEFRCLLAALRLDMRHIIWGLLTGEEINLPSGSGMPTPRFRLKERDKKRVLEEVGEFRKPEEGSLLNNLVWSLARAQIQINLDLRELHRQPSFPFRLCPMCQSVFVPERRRLYCSPYCRSQ
jgi:hypothetical protein